MNLDVLIALSAVGVMVGGLTAIVIGDRKWIAHRRRRLKSGPGAVESSLPSTLLDPRPAERQSARRMDVSQG
ncbi:hypothetical protein LX16_5055 [Stackebrandtia albiflava]|uniref:Uncharacterized protein n=1 Tax=Stackebrandtia albiflava TaxID=406432 RepID=A0A562UPM9_9ACTN|nr:hypothetical protein [Stackebrandtia albiflava]TWJ07569.1 hypothetical protein LX16_5055 [Stackebrandtia albiflava]